MIKAAFSSIFREKYLWGKSPMEYIRVNFPKSTYHFQDKSLPFCMKSHDIYYVTTLYDVHSRYNKLAQLVLKISNTLKHIHFTTK